jgi:hypothetical protein
MATLTRACNELFRRSPDERFPTVKALFNHCQEQKEQAVEKWHSPGDIRPMLDDRLPLLCLGDEGNHSLNDWSFLQLCQIAGVAKDTVNKVRPQTAVDILTDTLPTGTKPLQFLTQGNKLRSIHGAAYTRLFNADLLGLVSEFAVDFQPPQEAMGGGTGLYCGEQDMFCFLIDPAGWIEINDEPFAPGFFLWNSEVGKRSVGVQTFWFQAICQNHIVWDAVEVIEFTRKHTARVKDSVERIRQLVENLATKRDERRDGFAKVMEKAMKEKLGNDAEEVTKVLTKRGFPRTLAKQALEIAQKHGQFTVFALVDALTRIASEIPNAGDRTDADVRTGRLLALAA